MTYYRIKQIDADGSFSYSPVVAINDNSTVDEVVGIFPNPVSRDNRKIYLKGVGTGEMNAINIVVMDIYGRTIPYSFVGSNGICLSKALVPGAYFLKIKGKMLRFVVN